VDGVACASRRRFRQLRNARTPRATSAIWISLRTGRWYRAHQKAEGEASLAPTGTIPRLPASLWLRPFPAAPPAARPIQTEGRRFGNVNEYEILLLLDPDLDDDRQAEIVARTREQVESGGGTWDVHDVWGRRKLAYEIRHKADGSYHLLQFTCDAGTLDEVSRVLRIDDGVMRHMATRRIEGSPVRPVAVGAPAREDAAVASHVEEEEE
jgi:small subunit ribosomal protein S6